MFFLDEYKGHLLLEAARQADNTKLKKYLTADIVGFKHPYTGDTAVHAVCGSLYPKRKQVCTYTYIHPALIYFVKLKSFRID